MAKVRAKNTATAKDMMGCFVLWSREIDVESFRLSEQQVIVQNERLFSELLKKTVRPGQKEVQQGLSMAYQIGVDEAKAISKSICNAFKFARSKIQSCSSGKKLEPAVWKFVQRLKTLSASSSSPSSCRSLDLKLLRESLSSAHHPRPKMICSGQRQCKEHGCQCCHDRILLRCYFHI